MEEEDPTLLTIPKDSSLDPDVLFKMMFGSEIFEEYVGKLSLLSSPPPEFDPELPPEVQKPKLDEIMKALREERESKLSETLKKRLELYVKDQKDEMVKWAESEATRLSQAAYGKSMLHVIGYIYTRQAARHISKGKPYMKVPFLAEWVREKRHSRKLRASTTSAAVAYIKQKQQWKRSNEKEIKDEKTKKHAEKIKDKMLNSFWKMNVADIEMTLSHVCQAVLNDPNASKDIQKLRAKGMKKIGTIFQGVKARNIREK